MTVGWIHLENQYIQETKRVLKKKKSFSDNVTLANSLLAGLNAYIRC